MTLKTPPGTGPETAPTLAPAAGVGKPTRAGLAPRKRSEAHRIAFTDRGVRALKAPASGRVDVWDLTLPGFGVRISARGVRTWVVRYRHGRKQRRLRLGNFPPMSLAAARKQATRRLNAVDEGKDPAAEKAEARAASTFGELAQLYLEKHAPKKRSADEDRRIMERELLPRLRAFHARDVKRADVIALLDEIATRPAPIMSNRVLALLRKLYNFGIERGLLEANPCALVKPAGVEKRRERVLSEEEIRGLWRGLAGEYIAGGKLRAEKPHHEESGTPADPKPKENRAAKDGKEAGEASSLVAAVRLMLLTAQRRGEVLRMRWEDISEERQEGDAPTDGQKAPARFTWTIPAESAKNGRAHRVPLSPEALAVLESRPRSGAWVLPGRLVDENGKPREHVTNVERAIDRARDRQKLEHFTPHDLRRTAASAMTALGIPRLTVKKILNHVDRDVTGIYDRHSYDPEKRTALEAWGRRVAEIVTGEGRRGSVVAFRRA